MPESSKLSILYRFGIGKMREIEIRAGRQCRIHP